MLVLFVVRCNVKINYLLKSVNVFFVFVVGGCCVSLVFVVVYGWGCFFGSFVLMYLFFIKACLLLKCLQKSIDKVLLVLIISNMRLVQWKRQVIHLECINYENCC